MLLFAKVCKYHHTLVVFMTTYLNSKIKIDELVTSLILFSSQPFMSEIVAQVRVLSFIHTNLFKGFLTLRLLF